MSNESSTKSKTTNPAVVKKSEVSVNPAQLVKTPNIPAKTEFSYNPNKDDSPKDDN